MTNCLNFGNPQRPEIMAQFVGCLEGMGEACRALDFPIVSGNVSLYNESKATGGGSAILPTPAIGGVGLLEDWSKSATIGRLEEGDPIVLLGASIHQPSEHLGQSLWLREIHNRSDGLPPAVDLEVERRTGELVRKLIANGFARAVHDISDGGVLVALAEMALASGFGVTVSTLDVHDNVAAFAFGEDQGRYLVAATELEAMEALARAANVPTMLIAVADRPQRIRWPSCTAPGLTEISLADLRAAHEGFFPKLMGADSAVDATF